MVIGIDGNEANVKNRVGSANYTLELLKQFSKNKENDFLIYLKENPLPDLPTETKNFKYFVFGPKKLWTQLALSVKLTIKPRVNVFFSPAHYGPRFSKVPYVVTIHDLSYLHFPKLFRKEDLMQLTSWSKYSIENSVHIIVPSKSTKDDIIKNYKVPSAKITVTHEGYDESRFKSQSKAFSDRKRDQIESAKSKYQVKGDYIIFVGTIQPRKNIERLIEAFSSIIHNSKFNIQLVIAGKKGWLYDSILEKSKELKIENKVIFTGFVPDEDLPFLIGGAKVYILPSLWEGFGIPVIEAQACGVPVVVSNTSSLPEIVGDSGILIDPQATDSITHGIKKALDPKLRSNLIKKGLANIKRFSWKNCAKETLEVLKNSAV